MAGIELTFAPRNPHSLESKAFRTHVCPAAAPKHVTIDKQTKFFHWTLAKVTLFSAIGMEFLPSSSRDAPFYSSSIGVGSFVTPEGAEFELVMHHELAKALDRLLTEGKSGAAHE